MEIKSGKLCIRNARTEDAKVLSKWWNDGDVMAHAGFPHGLGISEEEVAERISKNDALNRRLILEYEKIPIGEMSYRTPEEKVAEIGIKICNPGQQNKGFGTAYLQMLMKYIFQQMGYEKIIMDTNVKNKRAQYVYEKLGFRKVGTNLYSREDQLGKLQSSIDYEILKEEF